MSRIRTTIIATGVVALTGLFCAGAWVAESQGHSEASDSAEVSAPALARTAGASIGARSAGNSGTSAVSVSQPAEPSVGTDSRASALTVPTAPTGSESSTGTSSDPGGSTTAPAPGGGSTWDLGPLPFGWGKFPVDLTAPVIAKPSTVCGVASDIITVSVTDESTVDAVWLSWQDGSVSRSVDLTHTSGSTWSGIIVPMSSGLRFSAMHDAMLHAEDHATNVAVRLVGTVC